MEKNSSSLNSKFGLTFMAVQVGVLILAVALIYFFKIQVSWSFEKNQLALAVIFALPMVLLAILFTSPVGLGVDFIRNIFDRITESPMGPFIQSAPLWALLIVSCLAGVGEELLFRGVLQTKIGLVASAFVFGFCHIVTFSFFAIAALIGVYLGAVYIWTDHNLLAPILIHAIYDFIVLVLMRRALT